MKYFLFFIIVFITTSMGNAQSLLERIGKNAKRAVEDKIEQTTQNAINDALNENDKEEQKSTEAPPESLPVESVPQEPQKPVQNVEKQWAKSDFVPGDEIMFEDNVIDEKLGEFPSQWDLLEGNAEVAKINGENAICLMANSQIAPLMRNMEAYLPDVYTIEFDFLTTDQPFNHNIRDLYFKLYDQEGNSVFELRFPDNDVEENLHNVSWQWVVAPEDGYRIGETSVSVATASWHRFSLSFNKRALKVYIDGNRIVNIPTVKQGVRFDLESVTNLNNEKHIKNIRIAKGAVPLYDRMVSEGKIISYGITFDVNKATLRPESMSTLNQIVALMTQNPDLKFSVEGHTDNTGSMANNQLLSESRAKAVVDKLVEMGIVKERLSSKGYGASKPIADNSNDEGLAKNRRVEFIRMR
ncbi:MAG: OmpA family protein [Bacteroidales bacterium]